ncbi:transcription initiation factor TFIID subunit 15b-like, partial [Trifolium medium]|nr:transcription initiation factor TFIID subunit 15b-like [Trifolium medium]
MGTPFDMLCDVLPGRDSWKFRVGVLRLWPVYSFLKSDEINGLEMVLIDEKMKTKVQICEAPDIPLFGFTFTDLNIVSSYDADFGFLLDWLLSLLLYVIGVLTGVSSEREYLCDGKVIKVIVLELTDQSDKCECALFGDYVDEVGRIKQNRGYKDQWPYNIKIYTDENRKNKGDACLAYEDPFAAHSAGDFYNDYELRGYKISVAMAEKSA